jgi:transmembrane sensor
MTADEPPFDDAEVLDDPVSAAALDWFVRLRDAGITPEQRRHFADWQAADPAHAAAYADVEAMWTDLDAVPAPLPLPDAWEDLPEAWDEPASPRRRRWPIWGGAIAASVALVIAAPQLWIAAIADAATTTGEVRQLTLDDGTRIALDASSAIDVTIDAGTRNVRLLKGRAWFHVAHENRPFIVTAGSGQVRDIGTAFEVTRRGEGGDVVVTEGLVELTAARSPARRLSAGQSARFDANGRSQMTATPPAPLAWVQGRLQFVDASVGDLLDDLARHGAGTPVILDKSLAGRRLTGAVDLTDPDAARDTILGRVGARARRVGAWAIVTRR